MTSAGPSLSATFKNPRFSTAAMAAGIKVREKMGVPYIAGDGVEHEGDWLNPTQVAISPGDHQVEVYFRLKGLPVKRGKGKANFTATEGQVSVHAEFGQFFTTTEVASPGQPPSRSKRMVF